jgi:ferredoxin-type protein NapH
MRRLVQACVLVALVLIPYMAANHTDITPGRIVQRAVPEPKVSHVSGDTWVFTAGPVQLAHPLAVLDEAVSAKALYAPMLLAALLPLLATVLMGRVFCSWLCPVGFLLELNQRVNAMVERAGLRVNITLKDLRYALLGTSLVLGLFLSTPVLSLFDPPHALGRELMYLMTFGVLSMSGTGFLIGLLALDTIGRKRSWCSRLCPSGGGLALIGAKRLLRIRMDASACTGCGQCDRACPYGLEPMVLATDRAGAFKWTVCDNCGLCRDACPEGAIRYALTTGKGGE